jgi:hypothetical protein
MTVAGDGRGIDQVKIIASGINSLIDFGRPTRPQFEAADPKAAVAAAHRRGLPVAEALWGSLERIQAVYCKGLPVIWGAGMGRSQWHETRDGASVSSFPLL